MHYIVRIFFHLYGFSMQRDRGVIHGEVCCMYWLVVRKPSICKDFPERQGMDTWRGMVHVLCCKKIFHL